MSFRVRNHSGHLKPSFGARIDRGHPLARGLCAAYLLNEGGGSPRNLATGVGASLAGSAAWTRTGVNIAGSAPTGITFAALAISRPVSFVGIITVTGGAGAYRDLFHPSEDYGGHLNSSDQLEWFDGSSFAGATALTLNRRYHYVFTIDAAGALSMYLDGKLDGSATGRGATSKNWVSFGSTNEMSEQVLHYAAIYKRHLSPAEVRTLYREPYAFLQASRLYVFIDQGDSGPTISGVGGIASAEVFGTLLVNRQVDPSAIASAEAFGTLSVNRQIEPGAIASVEAHGSPTLHQEIQPSAIASAEAFGTLLVNRQVEPGGIASLEAFGTLAALLQVSTTGIPSAEAFGTALVNQEVRPSAIASAEAFGNATVSGPGEQTLSPASIASAEAFGSPTFHLEVQPPSIVSAEAFGILLVNQLASPSSIASSEAFGVAALSLSIEPSGIASAEAFGTLRLPILPQGITSAEAFGSATISLAIQLPAAYSFLTTKWHRSFITPEWERSFETKPWMRSFSGSDA